MVRQTLDDVLAENDDLGLLNVKPHSSNSSTDAVRIQQAFEEVNVFVDRHHFSPGEGQNGEKISVSERTLQMRLKTYRDQPDISALLKETDRHGLLTSLTKQPPPPASLDDILALDDELLSDPNEDIFTFRHARPAAARPDKISERKPCLDFEQFKPLFDQAIDDLATGERKSMKFANEQEIEAGGFFILNGVMVYVAEVNDPHIRNGKRNARLRLIFENGTEGQNLLRSLATELYKDPNGRRLSDPNAGPLFDARPTTATVASPNDRITGCIYVVRSLSPSPEIAKLDGHLFKIGFTTGTFEDRIRGAKDDPTFLLAAVHPVRTYDAINLNANKFESLVHRFFADARLDIEIMDRFGKPCRPREWFLLPLPVIEAAITMLLDGSILRHRYDLVSCAIVPV
ncbi:MAG: GIY-YIG nuclease family protein [Gammaproteobacteria bacterium]|nr:GIY-YIG nuclease family protein [Gammaproteobacteria bacterium]